MKEKLLQLLQKYRTHLPAKGAAAGVGQRVTRDWLWLLATALVLFIVLCVVGWYAYYTYTSVEEVASVPADRRMPLDIAQLERVSAGFADRVAEYDLINLNGIDVPDPGTVTQSIIVDIEPSGESETAEKPSLEQ